MVDTPSRSMQRKPSFASISTLRNSPIRTTSLGQGLDKMESLGEERHPRQPTTTTTTTTSTRRRRTDSLDSLDWSLYSSEEENDDLDVENMQSPRKHPRTSRLPSAKRSPVQSLQNRAHHHHHHHHQHPAVRALFPASPNRKHGTSSKLAAATSSTTTKENKGALGRGLLSFSQSRSEQQQQQQQQQRSGPPFPVTAPPGERRSKFDMSGIQYDLPKISPMPFTSGNSSPPMPSPSPLQTGHFQPPKLPDVVNPLTLSSDRRRDSVDSMDSDSAAAEDEDDPEDSSSPQARMSGVQTMPAHMRASKAPRDPPPHLESELKKPPPPMMTAASLSRSQGANPHLRRSSNSAKPPPPAASTTSFASRSNPLFASHPLPSPAAKTAIPKSASTLFSSLRSDTHLLQPDPSSSSARPASNHPPARIGGNRSRTNSDASAGASYLESLDEDQSNDIFAPREPSFAMFDKPTSLFGNPAPASMSASSSSSSSSTSKSPFLTSTPKRERSETAPGHLSANEPLLSPTRKSTSFDDLLNASTSDMSVTSGSFWTKSTSTPSNLHQAAASRKRNANGAFVSGARVRSQLALNSPVVASPHSPFIVHPAPRGEDHGHHDFGDGDDSKLMIPDSPSWKDAGPPSSIPALTDSSSIASSLASSRDSSRMSLHSSLSSSTSGQHPRQQALLQSEPMVRRPSDTFSEGNTSLRDVKPLASAFESHGLVSKKGRYPRDSGVALDMSNFSFTSADASTSFDLSHSAILPNQSLMQSTKTMPGTPCKPSASILPNDLKLSKNRRKSGLSTEVTSPMLLDSPDSSPAKFAGAQKEAQNDVDDDDSPSKQSEGRDSTPSASPCMQSQHHLAAAAARKVQDTPSHPAIRRPGGLFRRRSSGQIKDDLPTFGRSASMAGERADSTDDEPMTPVRNLNKNGLFITVAPPLVGSPRKSPASATAALPQQGSDECTTPVSTEFENESFNSNVNTNKGHVTFAPVTNARPALAPKTVGRLTHPPNAQRRPSFRSRHSGSSVVTLRQLENQETDRFESDYQVQGVLGSGVSSDAFAVYNSRIGEFTAVKRIRGHSGGAKERARKLEEVDILRQLTTADPPNPFIIELRDAWEQSGQLFIETELCEHGNLAQYLNAFGNEGRLDEARQWKIAYELCSAVAFIHQHQMLHLDIKPANVFISQTGSLKLGDFGLATRWPKATHFEVIHGSGVDMETSASASGRNRPRAKSVGVGSSDLEREGDREYIAPELLRGLYGKPADVFSLGLSLLESVANVDMPGNGLPWHKLRSDDFSDIDFGVTSKELVALIQGLLRGDHEARLSAAQALNTPILQDLHRRFEADDLQPALVEEPSGYLEALLASPSTDCEMDLEEPM